MAGNRLFGHQGLLARSHHIAVKHGSGLTAQVNSRSCRIHGRALSLAQMRVSMVWLADPGGMRQGFLRAKRFDRQRSSGQIAAESFARATACARSAPVGS
jgi:hypothetical protein